MDPSPQTEDAQSSETSIEIRIRTLDSSTHTLRVDKNIAVPALKEQIAASLGVPAESQRLIFRGRVLKDDHALSTYEIEDGHTLHLVTRSNEDAPPQNQNQQNQTENANPQQQQARVTHSLLLGTINIPTTGDGGLPDFNRLVSAVLGGLGGGANVQPGAPQQNHGTQRQGGIPVVPSSFIPRSFEISNDALSTIAIYLARMEHMFALSGYGGQGAAQQPQNQPPSGSSPPTQTPAPPTETPPTTQAPTHPPTPAPAQPADSAPTAANAGLRQVMTPAALAIVIRRLQNLLANQVSSSLDVLAGQLETESTQTDVQMRAETQLNALWLGSVMNQLASLLLELGRSTSALHMGYSPAESIVNSGTPLYISTMGSNPIMVQPAYQTAGSFAPRITHMQAAPRSLNIHIHASDVHGGTTAAPASTAPAPGQPQPQPGLNMTADGGAQTVPPGSAVVQETIMIIQDTEAPYDPSVPPQPGTTTASTINVTGGLDSNPNVAMGGEGYVRAALERMFPNERGLYDAGFQMPVQGIRQGPQGIPEGSHMPPQGITQAQRAVLPPGFFPTAGVPPATAAPPPEVPRSAPCPAPTSAPISTPISAAPVQSTDTTTTTSAQAATAESSHGASEPAAPAGLGRQPLLRPSRRRVATRTDAAPRPRQPDVVSGQNLLASLTGLLRPPTAGGDGPAGGGEELVGRLLQQALPFVSQLLNQGNSPQSSSSGEGSPPEAASRADPAPDSAQAEVRVDSEKVEGVVKQLENGEPPQQVIRGVAQAAAESASVTLSEEEVSELVDNLSEEYASVLLQDMNSRLSES